MLDAISGGRLDAGCARAFLPRGFRRFKASLDESVARFDAGVVQIGALLSGENVTMEGRFHGFADVASHKYVVYGEGMRRFMGGIDDKPSSRHDTVAAATNYVRAPCADLAAGRQVAQAVTRP